MSDSPPPQPSTLTPGESDPSTLDYAADPRAPHRRRLIAKFRPLFKLLKYVLLALVLWFVYVSMRNEFRKTSLAELKALKPDLWLALASGLCLAGMNTVQMIRYRSLLHAYGTTPTWRQMAAIAWIPPLGKYIPGSVWALMGAIAMLKRFGINVTIAVSVVLMVDAFSEVVGLLLSVPLLLQPPFSDRFPAARWLTPILLTIGVVVMLPPVFNRLLGFGLRLIKRPPLERMPTWGEYIVPVLSAIAQWLFAGGALWCMTRSVTHVDFALFPKFVMVASAAMALGYLVFIAPAGAGPRELVFVTLLPSLLPGAPDGAMPIIVIAMRLMQVVVELSLAGLGSLMLRVENRDAAMGPLSPVPGGEG